MTKEENGDTRSSVQTEQSAPKEISSTPGQMKVSQTNTPSSGTRKTLSLLECEVDVATGETKHCRRIPIYEDCVSVSPASPRNGPDVSPRASNEPTTNGNCVLNKCNNKQRLEKTVGTK